MYSPLALACKYGAHFLRAKSSKGHGVHSPFVYALLTQVVRDKRHFYFFDHLENLRENLCLSEEVLLVEDHGAGSRTGAQKERTVGQIARSALKPKQWAQLLFRLVHHFQPQQVWELGTSLGLTTAYLAAANAGAQVLSFEGAPAIAAKAAEHHRSLRLSNIELVIGNFDDTLGKALAERPAPQFVFLDGNHQLEPTLRYFQQILPHLDKDAVVVLDDIHWSKEMESAWAKIQADPAVTLTIDLFFIGLVFFRTEQAQKEHFKILF